MSPRTEKQFQEIRKKKETLIMEAALRLFARHGYESTSVSMIVKEAGISKGLLYNYFESKEALLKRLIAQGMENFVSELHVQNKQEIKKEEIVAFIDGNIESVESNPEYFRLYFSLVFNPSVFDLMKEEIMPFYENLIEIFTLYFTQQGADDPYVKARYVLAVFDGVGIHYLADEENFPLQSVRNHLIKQF